MLFRLRRQDCLSVFCIRCIISELLWRESTYPRPFDIEKISAVHLGVASKRAASTSSGFQGTFGTPTNLYPSIGPGSRTVFFSQPATGRGGVTL